MTTIGILGGGQLGRMMAIAARPLDIDCICVEPAPAPPSAPVAEVIAAPFDDPKALATLADRCDAVTVELEHVPMEALAWLAERVPVRPAMGAVAAAQDRLIEKRTFHSLGIDTAPFSETDDLGRPAIVKTRFGGYDGKGQWMLRTPADSQPLAGCIVEGVVPFDREVSIVAVRSVDGDVRSYPLVENVHRDGILRVTRVLEASPVHADAAHLVSTLLDALDYVGVIAIELFDVGGKLVANEFAPRVHNSGHWTIEGAVTSQFENHVRAVAGLPLGDTSPRDASAMVNLIGELPDVPSLLALDGVHVHLYGKTPRAGRKLGHVTVTAETGTELDARLAVVLQIVGS
ncbi:MAG: 5-(carboxyamino)imidazole ribonucleotide synthase [Acidimicrobiia bacterium]